MGIPMSPDTRLFAGLAGLTAATGLVDAASYLGLGHVFTANMTGNVVFLGFALVGASGFSILASLLALGGFVVGALGGGRLVRPATAARDSRVAFSVEGAALVVAAVLTAVAGTPESGAVRWVLLGLLGAAMGLQNTAVRRLAVPDITTTVLTLTITGLAADSRLAGGDNPRVVRRYTAVLLMLGGGLVGAFLWSRSLRWPVVAAAALVLLSTTVLASGTKAASPARG